MNYDDYFRELLEIAKAYTDLKFKECGSVSVDLSNYYKKNEIDDIISLLESGNVDLSNYYNKTEINSKFEDIETAVSYVSVQFRVNNGLG